MYPYKYYQYINLPRIPDSILSKINYDFNSYDTKVTTPDGVYTWTDSYNQEINSWCQENICRDMYWAFQIIRGDFAIHKDRGTKTKFCYLLETGGSNVVTSFYDEDKTTVVDSVVLDPHRWHILKVDSYHGVTGIEPDKVRFSITGKIF